MPPRKARSVASSVRRPSSTSQYSDKIYHMSVKDMLMESDDSDGMNKNRKKTKSRQYIDPWDLENYIYLRSKIDPTFDEPHHSPSPAGEPINSRFYYVPGEYEECRRCCAGLDEVTFSNDRYALDEPYDEPPVPDDYMMYNNYQDYDSSSGATVERNNSFDSMSTLQLCTPNFGLTRMVVPKPMPINQLQIPPPPSIPPSSYDYYEIPSENHNYYSLNDCVECLQTEHVPIYATNRKTRSLYEPNYVSAPYCSTPYHFGLDKKGLLQIDYSCNWNNLHRYIMK